MIFVPYKRIFFPDGRTTKDSFSTINGYAVSGITSANPVSGFGEKIAMYRSSCRSGSGLPRVVSIRRTTIYKNGR